MHLCFIDESGDTSTLTSATCNSQPLLAICGLFINADYVKPLTSDFIALKAKHFPAKFERMTLHLDSLIKEIKGEDIRWVIRHYDVSSDFVENHFLYVDGIFELIKKYQIKIVGTMWVKAINKSLSPRPVYTITIQELARRFQKYLEEKQSEGIIIGDFRDTTQNSYVAHSIFTQKYKTRTGGDPYSRIKETATFGISKNHAGLQIADVICSTILFPSASITFCHPTINNVHTHPNYNAIKHRYKRRLMHSQYHCKDARGEVHRGLHVIDQIGKKKTKELFV